MAKRWRWWVVLAVMALVVWWVWPRGGGGERADAAPENPGLLTQGVWVDRDPREMEPTDFVTVFGMVEERDYGRVGAVLKASYHEFHLRLFNWDIRGGRGEVRYRQDGRVARFRYTIKECNELPPATHCLVFDKSPFGGSRKFYGPTEPDIWVPGKSLELRQAFQALTQR